MKGKKDICEIRALRTGCRIAIIGETRDKVTAKNFQDSNTMRSATVVLAVLLLLSAAVRADTPPAAPAYELNQHYKLVAHPVPPKDAKIGVEEFFWFGCPHCYKLDPIIGEWAGHLPPDAVFQRVPDNLGREEGVVHQRAFYIAQRLGIEDKIHKPLFDALVRDRKPLDTLPQIRQFFIDTAGVTPAQFDGIANSFLIDADLEHADQLSVAYGITSVPTLVIGGKYVTDASMPGILDRSLGEDEEFRRMLKVVDFLVAKVRGERKAPH
jgi:thiol:disulfide interchange protein DsbA